MVVQRGLEIGFCEYDARHEDLKNIPNFHHCVSPSQVIKTEEDCTFEVYKLDAYRDLMINIDPSLHGIVEYNNIGLVILPQPFTGIQQLSYGNYTGGVLLNSLHYTTMQ